MTGHNVGDFEMSKDDLNKFLKMGENPPYTLLHNLYKTYRGNDLRYIDFNWYIDAYPQHPEGACILKRICSFFIFTRMETALESKRWENQEFAVSVDKKIIFKIEDKEIVDGELIIYSGENTNTSKNLLTLQEAIFKQELDTFFQNAKIF